MKTKILVAILAGATLLSGVNSAYAQNPNAQFTKNHGKHGERHPEIRRAMMALTRAQGFLQHANRDFAGHREKALDLVQQAMKECQLALAADKT